MKEIDAWVGSRVSRHSGYVEHNRPAVDKELVDNTKAICEWHEMT
jgi:hypothetical protein